MATELSRRAPCIAVAVTDTGLYLAFYANRDGSPFLEQCEGTRFVHSVVSPEVAMAKLREVNQEFKPGGVEIIYDARETGR